MRLCPFGKQFDRESFDCGNEDLNRYLKQQISQDWKRSIAACFILVDDADEVRGYYTLSASGIQMTELPREARKGLPHYRQLPATLLGRLAVDKRLHGKGWGSRLLSDAVKLAWRNREEIGSWAVVVDAIDGQAAEFYEHFGFDRVLDGEERLFMPMKEIGKLMALSAASQT